MKGGVHEEKQANKIVVITEYRGTLFVRGNDKR